MGNAQRVDRGRAVAAELAAAERAPSAFLAGSNVVGLGSASSDIDVYLIGPGWVERRRQLHAGGTRVDVQTLASERLDALVDQVLGADSLPERDLVLAVRLLTGDVVVDDGALAGLRKRLAGRPLSLRRLVIGGWAATAYSAVEDVAGLRDSADQIDRDAAVLAGRRALLAAGKAIAASGGDLYYGDKWVGHQVARTVPAAFPFDRYRRLSLHGAFDALPEIVALVQSCLAAALTVGWWGVSLEHWPDWPGGGGALRRAVDVLPGNAGPAMVLIGPGGRTFHVPASALLVWGLCASTSIDQVTDRAVALAPLAEPWQRLDRLRVRSAVRELAAAGLIAGADDEV